VRYAIGVACVAVAAAILVVHVPRVVTSFDGQVVADAYITNGLTRLTTTGDALGIPNTLQVEALALIPKGSTYILALSPSAQAAGSAGISSLTYETVAPFLQYLLLPSQPATVSDAGYVICYGCDMDSWSRHARWLWDAGDEAIGRLTH
jgi:hypothetical protein